MILPENVMIVVLLIVALILIVMIVYIIYLLVTPIDKWKPSPLAYFFKGDKTQKTLEEFDKEEM